MRTRPPISRRGSVGLAMVIVLVILQLLLVGVIASGARDQDQAVNRLDTFRSAYAVESGENMALRELMTNTDQDGDGGVGTISNDGNPNNDPALGTARFCVTSSIAGQQTTLVSKGRAGSTRSQAQLVTEGVTGTVMAAFSRASSNQPRNTVWTSGGWGANSALPSIGGEAKFVRAVNSPTRNEVLFAAEDLNKDINVVVYNGSAWGTPTEVCSNTSTTSDRAFDVGYEQQSGDGLVVYWNDNVNQIGYRTWNGTTLSGESLLALSGSTTAHYVSLYPRPGSDQIILLTANNNGAKRLSAVVWNGTSWGAWTHLVADLQTDAQECYSLAFESLSRDALVAYSESGVMTPRYRTWNGASWSSQMSMPSTGDTPRWIRLAPSPTSDQILFADLDSNYDINVNAWNGSSWGSNLEVATEAGGYQPRRMDVSFERKTGKALLVYGENGSNQPRYRTWSGAVWSAQFTGPNIGAQTWFVHTVPGMATGDVMVAIADDDKDLHLLQWNGAALSASVEIETNLGSLSNGAEPAILAVPSDAGATGSWSVLSWTSVAPQ